MDQIANEKNAFRRGRLPFGLAGACFLACLHLVVGRCKAQAAPEKGTDSALRLPKVLLIGDSVMGLYCPIVQRELDATAEVNGLSRTTSRYVLQHLDEVIAAQPDIIHINCGLHDMILMAGTGKTQISLDEYKSNLATIFRRLARETHARVIWATTTPVSEERQVSPRPKGYGRLVRREADIEAYNRESLILAGRFGLAVDDLFEVMQRGGADKYFRTDGVHCNAAGNELLGQAVAHVIRSSLSQPRSPAKSEQAGAPDALSAGRN